MAHRAPESVLQDFLEGLREEIRASLCSSTGELISALQKRDIDNARQIAVRLRQELNLCDSHHPSYFLAQIVALLQYEDVFLHCDELSVWLLALERELQLLRISSRPGSVPSALVSNFEDGCTAPIHEADRSKCSTPGVGKWSGEGRAY